MDKKEFIEICSERKFWQWIRNKSLVKYTEVTKNFGTKKFLGEIFKTIEERTYYPSPPQEYLTLNKGKGVLRVIPMLSLKDLCVYYYCCRKLERYIALNHVSGTYGGFGLRGSLRKVEEEDSSSRTEGLDTISFGEETFVFKEIAGYPTQSSFNPKAWQAEWGDFNDKIYKYSYDFEEDVPDGVVAELDVSNFYDSIQLDNLEYKIRAYISNDENQVVYLLLHFLRFWNRHINFYRQQGAGIPQDIFGECSRILANFYLQSYDKRISSYCEKLGARYFRYADDQVIFAKTKKDLELIITKASSYLLREGLNFNQKKVNDMSFFDFRKYYGFSHFFDLAYKKGEKPKKEIIEKKINFYLKNKSKLRKNGISLLKRIINIIHKNKINPSNKQLLKQDILNEKILVGSGLSPFDLKKIYELFNKREQKKMISIINNYIETCMYTIFLYNAKIFFKEVGIKNKNINSRLKTLKNFYKWKV